MRIIDERMLLNQAEAHYSILMRNYKPYTVGTKKDDCLSTVAL